MYAASFLFVLAAIAALPFSDMRFMIGSVPLYLPECCVLVSVLLFFNTKPSTVYRRMQSLSPTAWPIFALLVGLMLSLAFASPNTSGLGIVKAWFFFPILFAWLLSELIRSRQQRQTVVWVWYGATSFIALTAILSLVQGILTYDGRLSTPYTSPNFLAMVLLPGIFLGPYLIHISPKPLLKTFLFLLWLIILIDTYATLSYGAWVGALIAFLFTSYLSLKKRSFKLLPALVIVAFFGVFILLQWPTEKMQNLLHFTERSSTSSRFMIWRSATAILKDHPFFGIGPGNFQDTYLAYQQFFPPYLEWAVPQPHNLYLAFWLQTGIIGLIGFLWLVTSWLRDSLRYVCQKQQAPLMKALVGIMAAILIHGLVDTPYWKTDLAYIFWLTIALGWTMHKEVSRDPSTISSDTVSRPLD